MSIWSVRVFHEKHKLLESSELAAKTMGENDQMQTDIL